jgi:hypothetical protein
VDSRRVQGSGRNLLLRRIRKGDRAQPGRFHHAGSGQYVEVFSCAERGSGKSYTNGSNYVGNGVAPSESYRIDTRMDHNWSTAWRMFGRVSWGEAYSEQFNPFGSIAMPGDGGGTTSPSLIMNVRYGLGRTVSDRNPFGAGFDVATIGLPAFLDASEKWDQSIPRV